MAAVSPAIRLASRKTVHASADAARPIPPVGRAGSRQTKTITLLTLALRCWLGVSAPFILGASAHAQERTITGALAAIWTDSLSGQPGALALYVVDDDGNLTELVVSQDRLATLGPLHRISGRRLTASGVLESDRNFAGRPVASRLRVDDMAFHSRPSLNPPIGLIPGGGSQPYATLLCRYSDQPSRPALAPIRQMFLGANPAGMDHYWREVSNGGINLSGSEVFGWYDLPSPKRTYITTTSYQLVELLIDCVAAADADVDFGNFVGINVLVNSDLGC